MFVAYSRASGVTGDEEYISSWVTVIEPGDTVPDAGNTVPLSAGDTFLNVRAGAERWGDYMAINRDPAGGSGVWVVGQAAHEAGPSTGDFRQHADLVGFP